MKQSRPQILFLNGSPSGNSGNCAVLMKALIKRYPEFKITTIHLKDAKAPKVFKALLTADALLVFSGTYWDSWGSPLQKFLEEFTRYEGHPELIGKPVGACILMHSVGGKEVLSRLQGVLNTMGFINPPMSGLAYSLTTQLALHQKGSHNKDFWSLDDFEVILKNLITASKNKDAWRSWPVDRKDPKRKWIQP